MPPRRGRARKKAVAAVFFGRELAVPLGMRAPPFGLVRVLVDRLVAVDARRTGAGVT